MVILSALCLWSVSFLSLQNWFWFLLVPNMRHPEVLFRTYSQATKNPVGVHIGVCKVLYGKHWIEPLMLYIEPLMGPKFVAPDRTLCGSI